MRAPLPTTQQYESGESVKAGADVGSNIFLGQVIDLKTLGARTASLPVLGLFKASARINAAAWGAAVVAVKGSIDNQNWTALAVAVNLSTGTKESYDFSIQGRGFIMFEVTTEDAAASSDALAYLYPYRL